MKHKSSQVFMMSKPNIMKKSKYQQYCHCFIVCILFQLLVKYGKYSNKRLQMRLLCIYRCGYYYRGGAYQRETLFQCGHSKILRVKNEEFSGYCFYMNTNTQGNFQMCISVPLKVYQLLLFHILVVLIIVLIFVSSQSSCYKKIKF